MSIITPDQLSIGDTIRFKSIALHDNVVWKGNILAICKYKAAKAFNDIDAYYTDIKKTYPSMNAKESLTYLILDVIENDGSINSTRAFAIEWIELSTLELVTSESYHDLRVYGVTDDKLTEIIRYINNDLGFLCEDVTK